MAPLPLPSSLTGSDRLRHRRPASGRDTSCRMPDTSRASAAASDSNDLFERVRAAHQNRASTVNESEITGCAVGSPATVMPTTRPCGTAAARSPWALPCPSCTGEVKIKLGDPYQNAAAKPARAWGRRPTRSGSTTGPGRTGHREPDSNGYLASGWMVDGRGYGRRTAAHRHRQRPAPRRRRRCRRVAGCRGRLSAEPGERLLMQVTVRRAAASDAAALGRPSLASDARSQQPQPRP